MELYLLEASGSNEVINMDEDVKKEFKSVYKRILKQGHNISKMIGVEKELFSKIEKLEREIRIGEASIDEKYQYKCPDCQGEFSFEGIRRATTDGCALCPYCGKVMKGTPIKID